MHSTAASYKMATNFNTITSLETTESMALNASHTIATMPEPAFQTMVNRARRLQTMPRYWVGYHDLDLRALFPQWQDTNELLATGDRAYILATLESWRQEQLEAKERRDPGGRKAERQLELMDRRYTEERKKRREKRANDGRCVIM